MIGVVIGNYQLVQKLGEGGMGVVYLGQHTLLGRRAAIKVLLPALSARTDVVARFFNEARAVTSISDLGIVQVFDFGYHTDGSAFIVMEFLEGEPLDRRLARLGRLAVHDALRLCRQVASSLAAAHAQNIVHRDLKPENIFLVHDGEAASGERSKILDFGIAKLSDEHPGKVKTHTGMLMGTPTYMSPEQCRGVAEIDHRSDIYALGCVLFHLLTGRPPFEGEGTGDIIIAHVREPAPAPSSRAPEIPPGVDALVLRCLAKAPADRFQTMVDLVAAVGSLLQEMFSGVPAGVPVYIAPAYHSLPTAQVQLGGTLPPSVSSAGSLMPVPSTTFGGGAGQFAPTTTSSSSPPRRIGLLITGLLVLGAAGTGIAVVGTRNDKPKNSASVVTPGSATNGAVLIDAGEVASMISEHLGSGVVVDAAIATSVASKSDDDPAQQANKCTQLQATKNWQELIDCAKSLAALGAKDKAKEFYTKAVKEQANEFGAKEIESALHDGNLKQAERLLTRISEGSIYYKDLHDQFLKAEDAAVEDARRQAQGLAAAHDCATLKHYVAQQDSDNTERVAATIQAIRCAKKTQAPDSPVSKQPNGNSGGSGRTPPVEGTRPKNLCDTMKIDDVMAQAQNQYSAGSAKTVLALVVKALECKQDVTMYRMAGTLACAARDLAAAKLYYARLSGPSQTSVEQVCQRNGLDLGVKSSVGNGNGNSNAGTTAVTPPEKGCATMDVNDVMKQAADQRSAGHAKSALALVVKGLACKQSVFMYQMAGMYACAAHDLASAKTYLAKVPSNNQAAMKEKCQQEGLNLRDQ